MDIQAFLKGFSAFTAIPLGQSERALLIAEGLSDEDRGTFFTKLQDLNDKLEVTEKGRHDALAGADQVIVSAEKQEKNIERKAKETTEQEQSMRSAEQKLSDQS